MRREQTPHATTLGLAIFAGCLLLAAVLAGCSSNPTTNDYPTTSYSVTTSYYGNSSSNSTSMSGSNSSTTSYTSSAAGPSTQRP